MQARRRIRQLSLKLIHNWKGSSQQQQQQQNGVSTIAAGSDSNGTSAPTNKPAAAAAAGGARASSSGPGVFQQCLMTAVDKETGEKLDDEQVIMSTCIRVTQCTTPLHSKETAACICWFQKHVDVLASMAFAYCVDLIPCSRALPDMYASRCKTHHILVLLIFGLSHALQIIAQLNTLLIDTQETAASSILYCIYHIACMHSRMLELSFT